MPLEPIIKEKALRVTLSHYVFSLALVGIVLSSNQTSLNWSILGSPGAAVTNPLERNSDIGL